MDESLALLPYEELVEICYESPEQLEGCKWDLWKEKAVSEGIPEQYFDLAIGFGREISGIERYLEIKAFSKLSRHSITKKRFGFLEGVYEPYAGLKEAVFRNDPGAVGIFYPKVSKEGREEIAREKFDPHESALALEALSLLNPRVKVDISPLDIKVQEAAKNPEMEPPKEASQEDLFYLIRHNNILAMQAFAFSLTEEVFLNILISGRLEVIYHLLPLFFRVVKGYNIATDIPLLPFSLDPNIPLYDLGYTKEPETKYLAAAVESLNPQLVDFFRSLYGMNKIPGMTTYLVNGYERKRDPINAFSILQRLEPPFDMVTLATIGNIDLFLYALPQSKVDKHVVAETFIYNQGNITFLQTFIDRVSRANPKVVKRFLKPMTDSLYPLTKDLVYDM